MNSHAFNQRTSRARISASWPHDQSHYRFHRQHKSQAPFVELETVNRATDIVVGVLAVIGLAVVLAYIGGWI